MREVGQGIHSPDDAPQLPEFWLDWFTHVGPQLDDFADHHYAAGEWLEELTPSERCRPHIDVWSRAHGKSTFCEYGVAYVAEQRKRRFALYICDTQDQAEKHVSNIQAVLESVGGPIGRRLENQYGHSKGWRANMLRTASGFNCVPLGLDVAMRGVKLEDYRPDLIICDDIDGRHDSAKITKKKIEILTESILPAGSPDCAIWIVQNLIIHHGIVSKLVRNQADFLALREVNGPIPAVRNLVVEDRVLDELGRTVKWITSGQPTWEAHDLEACQRYILDFGWRAFDREMQHNVADVAGALWTTALIGETRCTPEDVPELTRIVVAVDPATTSKDSSNETGIVACGRAALRHGYVLADRSGTYPPHVWGRRAVQLHDQLGAESIVVEDNQGGEMVTMVVQNAAQRLHKEELRDDPYIKVRREHAVLGKRARAEPVAQMYEEKAIHHVGDHPRLEEQMTTWDATSGDDSPDQIDALVLGMTALGVVKKTRVSRGYVSIED